jgi:hypothetical protein
MCVCIFEMHWHDVMYMSITMQYLHNDILHCPLSLEIMVCEELRVWHLTLFINKCGFLKQEDKTTRKERWWLGGHLGNKSLMKPIVRSFKMAMMLPLKTCANCEWKWVTWGSSLEILLCTTKMKRILENNHKKWEYNMTKKATNKKLA